MKHYLTLALGIAATAGVNDVVELRSAQAAAPSPATDFAQTDMPVTAVEPISTSQDTIALSFEPPTSAVSPPAPVSPPPASTTQLAASAPSHSASTSTAPSREDLFAGGSESVVARTVGAAEGTRTSDGGKTDIYDGHVDPGNGVWNRGTFSYQFGNEENLSATEADRRQLAKIKRIYESVLLPKAEKYQVAPLTLAEELNGIDLINQAPLTVTEDGGYIERLAEAKTKKGLSGQEAILEARIWSFWDGSRGGWDAPGLRAYDDLGKEASIRHDQKRRMGMIDEALAAYEQQHGAIAERPADKPDASPQKHPVATRSTAPLASAQQKAERQADSIIFGSASRQDSTTLLAQN
jgi:hypothetical protein